jgi:hypothetical protein
MDNKAPILRIALDITVVYNRAFAANSSLEADSGS